MRTELQIRALRIFEAALSVPAAERPEFIRDKCQGDVNLLAAVESMLARKPETSELPSLALSSVSSVTPEIPPYEIDECVGAGSYGRVFRAVQPEPKRDVAIKVLQLEQFRDTEEARRRFAIERQALAVLDHPYVAKVHDAGSTVDGHPYFVLEYVDGHDLKEYCEQERPGIRARLELFVKICEGVEHAHRKLVIHRDLKPRNILVQHSDSGELGSSAETGVALPKIIDFGIAKSLGASLIEATLRTSEKNPVGTPQYMSPEQIAGSADIDTGTDVYALGVILYELLVGTPPFVGEQYEVLRAIQETDPPAPSTRLSGSDPLDPWANRREAPSEAARLVRGELDWITMRALKRERGERYQSVAQLREDVQCYLRSDALIYAGPPTLRYRLASFIRRNRRRIALLTAVGFIVAGTATLADYQAKQRALVQEATWKKQVEDLNLGMMFLLDGRSDDAEAMLRPLSTSPRVGMEASLGLLTISVLAFVTSAQQPIGTINEERSEDDLQSCRLHVQDLLTRYPELKQESRVVVALGSLLEQTDRLSPSAFVRITDMVLEATDSYVDYRIMNMLRSLLPMPADFEVDQEPGVEITTPPDPRSPEQMRQNLGRQLIGARTPDLLLRCLYIRAHDANEEPQLVRGLLESLIEGWSESAAAWYFAGQTYEFRLRDKEQALECYQEANRLDPSSGEHAANLGELLWQRNEVDQAVSVVERALDLGQHSQRSTPFLWNTLGLSYWQGSDLEEAARCFRNAVEIEPNHYPSWINLVDLLIRLDDFPAAVHAGREGIRAATREGHTANAVNLTTAHLNFANALLLTEGYDEAREQFEAALGLRPSIGAEYGLVLLDLESGDLAAARAGASAFAAKYPNLQYGYQLLAQTYVGKRVSAEELDGAKGLELAEKAIRAGGTTHDSLAVRADAEFALGQTRRAIATIEECLELLRTSDPQNRLQRRLYEEQRQRYESNSVGR